MVTAMVVMVMMMVAVIRKILLAVLVLLRVRWMAMTSVESSLQAVLTIA